MITWNELPSISKQIENTIKHCFFTELPQPPRNSKPSSATAAILIYFDPQAIYSDRRVLRHSSLKLPRHVKVQEATSLSPAPIASRFRKLPEFCAGKFFPHVLLNRDLISDLLQLCPYILKRGWKHGKRGK